MRTEPGSSLSRQATALLDEVAATREPILITHDCLPCAYLVDAETFEGMSNRVAVLEAIGLGEAAAHDGRTIPHDEALNRVARWLK